MSFKHKTLAAGIVLALAAPLGAQAADSAELAQIREQVISKIHWDARDQEVLDWLQEQPNSFDERRLGSKTIRDRDPVKRAIQLIRERLHLRLAHFLSGPLRFNDDGSFGNPPLNLWRERRRLHGVDRC